MQEKDAKVNKLAVPSLLLALFLTATFVGDCGGSNPDETASPSPTPSPSLLGSPPFFGSSGAVSYQAAGPIIDGHCSGSSCHGPGAAQTVYYQNETAVDADKAIIYKWVSSGNMPLDGSLAKADVDTLLQYCLQQ